MLVVVVVVITLAFWEAIGFRFASTANVVVFSQAQYKHTRSLADWLGSALLGFAWLGVCLQSQNNVTLTLSWPLLFHSVFRSPRPAQLDSECV